MQAIKTFISKYKAVFYLLFVVGVVVVLQFLMKNQGGLRHYGEVLRNTLFNPELNDNLNGILSLGMFGYLGNLTLQMPLWLIFMISSFLPFYPIKVKKVFLTKTLLMHLVFSSY